MIIDVIEAVKLLEIDPCKRAQALNVSKNASGEPEDIGQQYNNEERNLPDHLGPRCRETLFRLVAWRVIRRSQKR